MSTFDQHPEADVCTCWSNEACSTRRSAASVRPSESSRLRSQFEHGSAAEESVTEKDCYQQAKGHFSPQGNLPNLQRYRTASQRALEKNLELLEKLPPPTPSAADEAPSDGDAETGAPGTATTNSLDTSHPSSDHGAAAMNPADEETASTAEVAEAA